MDNFKICPKCSYMRSPEDDLSFSAEECPKCRIIYRKFTQKKEEPSLKEIPQNRKENIRTEAQRIGESKSGINVKYAAAAIAAILIISFFLIGRNKSENNIPDSVEGVYSGEVLKEDGTSLNVKFRVSKGIISEISTSEASSIGGEQNTDISWSYPDRVFAEYTLSGENSETRSCTLSREANRVSLKLSALYPAIYMDEISVDLEKKPHDEKYARLQTSKNPDIFFTSFTMNISDEKSITPGKEQMHTPASVGSDNICRHCNICSRVNEILYQNRGHFFMERLNGKDLSCSMNIGNFMRMDFSITPLNLQENIRMKAMTMDWYLPEFDMSINEGSVELMLSHKNPLIRISLNKDGYGFFSSTEGFKIPVKKEDLTDTENNMTSISEEEWESVFRNKNDPRFKHPPGEGQRKKAFERMKKRYEEKIKG